MTDVAALVTEIESLVRGSVSASELTAEVSLRLKQLRELYVADKSAFSAEQVRRLQFAASIPALVADFLELLEESHYITHREDVEELVGRFLIIEEGLTECLFSQRAAKEGRELLERYESLPARWRSQQENVQRERESRIERLAPNCPICATRLVLRESMYGLFWGCRSFPSCFGKKGLDAEQAMALRNSGESAHASSSPVNGTYTDI